MIPQALRIRASMQNLLVIEEEQAGHQRSSDKVLNKALLKSTIFAVKTGEQPDRAALSLPAMFHCVQTVI
jgi:hypothetical protein